MFDVSIFPECMQAELQKGLCQLTVDKTLQTYAMCKYNSKDHLLIPCRSRINDLFWAIEEKHENKPTVNKFLKKHSKPLTDVGNIVIMDCIDELAHSLVDLLWHEY